jgi:prevent-host-death family protein
LAPEIRLWALAGTILGTVAAAVDRAGPSCDHHIQCELDEDVMLDLANDIRSLSEFKRNTVDLLERLRKTGHPLVLTINGKAELVVQDAAAYQALLDRVEVIEGIHEGLGDVKAGRTKPARQVFARLRRKHGVPR